ncbi:MAG: DNA/RNA nuclease SfsA [bacterium]|jgi:sugar fermentation stimulation protein A|nr:MAG: DNA/RNA nuclease SfsA [bacterium]
MSTIATPIPGPLEPARFVERPNRFLIRCRLEATGEVVGAHLGDPGRLEAIFVPGRRVWVRPSADPARRTRWTALVAESPVGEGWVSLDSTLPNRLVRRALEAGALPELDGWQLERAEWRHGSSRFDFLLAGPGGRRLALEVKGVNLVEDGVAMFPDAPTARGARHLRELAQIAARDGWEAGVLFIVHRKEARAFRAAAHIDPQFSAALDDAARAGVRVMARLCAVALDRATLGPPLPWTDAPSAAAQERPGPPPPAPLRNHRASRSG